MEVPLSAWLGKKPQFLSQGGTSIWISGHCPPRGSTPSRRKNTGSGRETDSASFHPQGHCARAESLGSAIICTRVQILAPLRTSRGAGPGMRGVLAEPGAVKWGWRHPSPPRAAVMTGRCPARNALGMRLGPASALTQVWLLLL